MDYCVRLFGPLAQTALCERVTLNLDTPAPTVADLRAQLGAVVPALAPLLGTCRFAVNHAFVPESQSLHGQDEIALIGLVSGG